MAKPRGQQVGMTLRRRRELTQFLNELAESGDANAAGWLLLLDALERRELTRG
ncbi:hypothetical protein [Halomonas hibernica]|uniref:hypothetical protein n=1 Tax=Halomonas hibernica TaxID=2591147 RepID=UPI001554A5F2|nr:hypothetical protein [Halomonas hibernica]